jgi:adenylosuccinate synthase
MLDEDRIDQWPHVTRSKTGLDNVVFLARRFGLSNLEVTYVSRTYLTRHGAGPLEGESDWSLPDRTNVTNQFQGQLRFAPLDCKQLQNSVLLDLARSRRSFPSISANLALTCADQIPLPARNLLPLPLAYISYGPTRNDVSEQSGNHNIVCGNLINQESKFHRIS